MIKKKSGKAAKKPGEFDPAEHAAPLVSRFWIFALAGAGSTLLMLAVGVPLFYDYWTVLPADAAPTYVGRGKCIECHQTQAHSFSGSHHDLAMDLATDDTVLGKFDGGTLEHFGVTSRMYRDGKRFMINTEGPDGKPADFEIKYVFGVTPLQQYMVEFDRPADMPENEIARLQVLRVSWDTKKEKWFYLPAPDVDEKLEPGDDLHWTGIAQRWNTMCADCHSTNLEKNYDATDRVYHTTFSEIDVSCEACHGPGSNHVKLAETKWLFWDREQGYALPKLKSDDSHVQIETCARCHSRRRVVHPDFRPGDHYHDYYSNELLLQTTYHADGQILDEVYVYGSFIQSKMYHKNIRCTDCHDPHTARLKHEGNKVCTSCHQHPAGKYDGAVHHRHNSGSTGASCVECHMPETTYMEVDPRRDHSLRVPRPDLSVKTRLKIGETKDESGTTVDVFSVGTPNACTRCHLDPEKLSPKSRAKLKGKDGEYAVWLRAAREGDEEIKTELARLDKWAADQCVEWYGEKTADQPHFAEVLAPARQDMESAEAPLEKLARERQMPAIVRATAVAELGRFTPLSNNVLYEKAVYAENAADRREALGELLKTLEPYRQALRDPSPQVRAAALVHFEPFIPVVHQQLREDALPRLEIYLDALLKDLLPMLGDESRLVRTEAGRVLSRVPQQAAGLVMTQQQREQLRLAIDDYKSGVLVDNDRAAAHLTLGILYENLGQDDLAEQAYLTGSRVEPGAVGPRANLAGLYERLADQANQAAQAYAQQGNQDATVFYAREAHEYRQSVARLRREELSLLERDSKLAPDSAIIQYRYGLSLYLDGRLEEAEAALKRAVEIAPENDQFLSALIGLYEQQERWQEGLPLVRKLLELEPDYPPYQEWLKVFNARQPSAGPALPQAPASRPNGQ